MNFMKNFHFLLMFLNIWPIVIVMNNVAAVNLYLGLFLNQLKKLNLHLSDFILISLQIFSIFDLQQFIHFKIVVRDILTIEQGKISHQKFMLNSWCPTSVGPTANTNKTMLARVSVEPTEVLQRSFNGTLGSIRKCVLFILSVSFLKNPGIGHALVISILSVPHIFHTYSDLSFLSLLDTC